MNCTIRRLQPEDEPFLWEMLYQALYLPEGAPALPRQVLRSPELARYVAHWGRKGDVGFLASTAEGIPVGAVWLRLPMGEHKGYGYIRDDIPELSMAVLPDYRVRGIGTQLLSHLARSEWGRSPISLSVSVDNPAVRLYKRFEFTTVVREEGSLIMQRSPSD